MSEPARNRFALDLEDLERQLRGAGQAPRPGQSPDPLAELTRIVGQDDPLKDIFAERRAPAPHAAPRHEPSFELVPPSPVPAMPEPPAPPAELRGALDEFEALLRQTEPRRAASAGTVMMPPQPAHPVPENDEFEPPAPLPYARPVPAQSRTIARDLDEDAALHAGSAAYPDEPAPQHYAQAQHGPPAHGYDEDDYPDLEPRRSRKGLWAAAAVIAVGLLGVGTTFALRGGSVSRDGQPPMITADRGPVKVEPANPGGAEIPNQNKQIYERSADAPQGQSKVVNNEEQPVDVQQAARSMPPRVVTPSSGTALAAAPSVPERSITPAEPGLTPMPPVPGLGEPRKVRTVAIRPDGTPVANPVAVDGSQPIATGSAPTRSIGSAPAAPPQRPAVAAAPAAAPKVQERATTPPAATTPVAPTRVASAPPAPAAAPPAPATSAIRAGTGDFVVQLGAPGSEAEARATFAALQRKYPQQLGGQPPIVRKTELAGGKTVYRLRVGPYSREDASTMCSALQAAGGQCFIAKN
ncbi:SPOR domain-containing protein [Hyphomicrobiales bacterium]|nr:SPOR domain-containing protein [Hyphomicrobiales bacterium]CAH1701212.1 SPOR domain-containing protein [Hyphomicrobiales bacterium]CAI0345176.1 SPOR domain-containing protein [Hyphomicrobiales bacterium]